MAQRIILPGGAGLVGHNLVIELERRGHSDIVVLDKHRANLATMRRMHPGVTAIEADLSGPGRWQHHFEGADAVVMLQAQIGGLDYRDFERNNIESTRLVLEAIADWGVPYLVHVSSSVVKSTANDSYTNTKKEQERLVLESGVAGLVLRPTLMFGWFDRKHLGWLSRFMQRVPVFPIPGDGRYVRQPLYVGDFCDIIANCVERGVDGGIYNISGRESVYYIDIIREIRRTIGSKTPIVKMPCRLFHILLTVWAFFDRNPPFTTQQLEALVATDEFEVTDWPGIFDVTPTPFSRAIQLTFADPVYSSIALEF